MNNILDNGKIIILREFGSAAMRTFDIFINDEYISEISCGESFFISLPQGHYTLYTKIDWCRSATLEFDIKENDIKCFSTNTMGLTLNPLALFRIFIPKKYLELKQLKLNTSLLIKNLTNIEAKRKLIKINSLDSKNTLSLKTTLFPVNITKDLFSNVTFPKDTDVINYSLSKTKKNIIFSTILLISIQLIFHGLNNNLTLSNIAFSVINSIILSLIIYFLFRPMFSK